MKILIDKYIPFIKGLLEAWAQVEYLEPEQFSNQTVKDADALLVRTRTRCNASLLEGSRVRFIATATIGYDHIDTAYCFQNGIFWTNAAGCNAQGVCDYVEAAIDYLTHTFPAKHFSTIGIVGVGHVGSLVVKMAQRKGLRVLVNDPPKEDRGETIEGLEYSTLAQIAREADIITFHTPLTKAGPYPSYHLCNDDFLLHCKNDVCIINAARGGVVDEAALLQRLRQSNHQLSAIIDTWEGEPNLNTDLLYHTLIGTYHIAGYTMQGKVNATNMCLDALTRYFNLPKVTVPLCSLPTPQPLSNDWLLTIDQQLRLQPHLFEHLRETYPLR